MARSAMQLAAIGQMTATSSHAANLAQVSELCARAAAAGAKLLCIPEAFAFIGSHYTETVAQAEPLDGPRMGAYRQLAAQHKLWLSLGGFHERPAAGSDGALGGDGGGGYASSGWSVGDGAAAPAAEAPAGAVNGRTSTTTQAGPGGDGPAEGTAAEASRQEAAGCGDGGTGRVFNTHVILDSEGRTAAVYRKAHLFDVEVTNGPVFLESRYTAPGPAAATVLDSPIGRLGLTTCYDLRFPELFVALARRGAEVILVPSAFTVPTGKAHWHLLLRARAVETQTFVLAAAQAGRHSSKRESYGHALAVDPWGEVLADAGAEASPAIVLAEIDLDRLRQVRERMPIARHRRDDVLALAAAPLSPMPPA